MHVHDTYVLSVRQRDTKNVFILALIVKTQTETRVQQKQA